MILGINLFLCYKCYSKRVESERIREEMEMKRMEYAAGRGLIVDELDDPLRFQLQTVHI